MKTFKKFVIESSDSEDELFEANLLSKTYALAARSKGISASKKVEQFAKAAISSASRVKSTDDVSDKMDLLAVAIKEISGALFSQGNLSRHSMNLTVGTHLLSDNIVARLNQGKKKRRR